MDSIKACISSRSSIVIVLSIDKLTKASKLTEEDIMKIDEEIKRGRRVEDEIDTNKIIACLLGDGKVRRILFLLFFYTVQYVFIESCFGRS